MKETVEEAALRIIPDKSTAGWVDGFSATERIGFVKGAQWQSEQDNWISVEERLPTEKDVPVVCYQENEVSRFNILVLGYDGVTFREFNTEDLTNGIYTEGWFPDITHWQPLPTPPKKETEK